MGQTGNRRRIGWLLGAVLLAFFVCGAAGDGAAAEGSDSSDGYSITTTFFSDKQGGGYADFSLYTYPAGTLDGWEDVEITLEGEDGCGWALENGSLRVVCPTGRRAVVTIRCENGVNTTFSVSNPGAMTRWIVRTVQVVDRIWAFARDGRP